MILKRPREQGEGLGRPASAIMPQRDAEITVGVNQPAWTHLITVEWHE